MPSGSDRIRTSTLPILPTQKAFLRDQRAAQPRPIHGSRLRSRHRLPITVTSGVAGLDPRIRVKTVQYVAVTTVSTAVVSFVVSLVGLFWSGNPLHLPF